MSVLEALKTNLEGDLFTDITTRLLYSTDASVYRELPYAVSRPKTEDDIRKLISFASINNIPLIPRTAGTSLAGQVVGHGIVMDFSRYMNKIIEFNPKEKWIKVQPGVILDELNEFIKPHGLFFGPETSTSNRCMIGGMLANNACGSRSLIYGSTRDHTHKAKAFLSDGSQVLFGPVSKNEFRKKCIGNKLENVLYQDIFKKLSDKKLQKEIENEYPDKRIKRRNTGYALDLLLQSNVFKSTDADFNFCKLLAGSEGSLAVFTEITLNLVSLPPEQRALICVHVNSVEEALEANLSVLKHNPVAVELIDKNVLDCTKSNKEQSQNRFFISGDPEVILIAELAEHEAINIEKKAQLIISDLQKQSIGYHYPVIYGENINRVWALRKAGLGLLSNMPGDAKPVTVIEDTAVHVESLTAFINELKTLLNKIKIRCVYYAHVGTGQLHLRPILNLKNPVDVERFYHIAYETARLVKKYKGSLSGEHGDGRLRGEFIPLMLGDNIYQTLKQIKNTWDPNNIFNPGKITDTPSMKSFLRYKPDSPLPRINTYFRYPESEGFLRGIEKCSGSADCRKPATLRGVMCPSYQATKNEYDSTRGRANILREYISNSKNKNPFNHKEIYKILDLCLSCKACKTECPSNVDIAKYKAEFLQNYYDANKTPLKAILIANINTINRIGSFFPAIFNFFTQIKPFSYIIKQLMSFTTKRQIPKLSNQALRKWSKNHLGFLNQGKDTKNSIVIFCDEYTNYNDAQTGINAAKLLSLLGYYVIIPNHKGSHRASISKGFLKKSSSIANINIEKLYPYVEKDIPVIGIEPSAIACLRDEYKDLCNPGKQYKANKLAANSFIIDEFICQILENTKIDKNLFTKKKQKIYLHGHCHQKAISSTSYTKEMLSIPSGFEVIEIDCGCCGMAGAFGFEKDHYKISMKIGELKLFPAIRKAEPNALIAAPGTSCRQQIFDGTGRNAKHPVDILYDALM